MAFGIGVNTEQTDQEAVKGVFREAAVKCWFTASGRSMPLMLKVETEDGEITEIDHIQVLTAERQRYAGILNWKYCCQAEVGGQMREFILLFCPEECAWKVVV